MPAGEIGTQRRWNRSGRPPLINRQHPLATGLWFHVLSASPGRAASTPGWAISPFGLSMNSTSNTAQGWAVKVPRPIVDSMDGYTFHTIKSMTAKDTAWAMDAGVPFDSTAGTWAAPFWAVALAEYNTTNNGYMHCNVSGTQASTDNTQLTQTGYSLSDGVAHSYTGTWGVPGVTVYRDGVKFDSNAVQINGNNAFTPTITGQPELSFMNRSVASPGEGFTGWHMLTICWTRVLADQEVAQVHADPFCMLLKC